MHVTAEKRKEQTQDDAENDAGDDREIKGRVPALDPDVARQTSEPAGSEPAPEHEPENEQGPAEDHQEFGDFSHRRDKVAAGAANGKPSLAALDQGDDFRLVKLGQLSEAAIYTSDLDAAEKFYRDVLGLEKISEMENRGMSFRCGATVLLIFDPARTRISDREVPTHGADGRGHIAFVIHNSEIEGWRTQLSEHGVVIEAEVEWPEGGRSIYFRDPAGNSVELAPPLLWL
jgi:catechol 2,3-dioxygenase-like lactoylglutathione lyase family enzyme